MFVKFVKSCFFSLALFSLSGCEAQGEVSKNEPFNPITWSECSQQMGDHPCDFNLLDQHGENWNLYDHWGSIVVLDFSTEWCGWCQVAAQTTEEIQATYAEDDLVYVTILVEDIYGNPPEQEILERWGEAWGISAPILGGDRSMIDPAGLSGWPVTGWPRFFFIDRELRLSHELSGYNDDALRYIIDTMIEEDQADFDSDL